MAGLLFHERALAVAQGFLFVMLIVLAVFQPAVDRPDTYPSLAIVSSLALSALENASTPSPDIALMRPKPNRDQGSSWVCSVPFRHRWRASPMLTPSQKRKALVPRSRPGNQCVQSLRLLPRQ